MLETIIVIIVIALAALFLVLQLLKALRGESECCGTSSCSGGCKGCPAMQINNTIHNTTK